MSFRYIIIRKKKGGEEFPSFVEGAFFDYASAANAAAKEDVRCPEVAVEFPLVRIAKMRFVEETYQAPQGEGEGGT